MRSDSARTAPAGWLDAHVAGHTGITSRMALGGEVGHREK